MKHLYLLFLPFITCAQVTIIVNQVPSNTPANSDIFLAGSINDWNPGNDNYILQPIGGSYQIVIPEGTGTVEFKFTRGSWPTVEGNATGGYLPNRSFSFTGSPQTIYLQILSWEDLGGSQGSTAASNVAIISSNFFMPQLNANRRIWIYLPPDYEMSTKNYPVIYMHDGQNLFDAITSFAGEWQVDETLNTLFNNGDYGAIVVGIDNGGASRLDEYSPWNNPSYGGGDGDDYMAFLAQTLKPYIDANYRTRPEPQFNAVAGSSMGALISTYGACEYPDVFRKVGAMSPAYWFALSQMNDYLTSLTTGLQNHRMYFVCGENESASMVADVNSVRNLLIAKGLAPENAFAKFDSYGTHTEGYWAGEFGAMYSWLFEQEDLAAPSIGNSDFRMLQTPSGRIVIEGLYSAEVVNVIDLSGRTLTQIVLENGTNFLPENLTEGIYILSSSTIGNRKVFKFRP